MTRSAIVRRSSIEVESAVRPMIIISPRIDDWGPITGSATFDGSSTSARRSATVWRAMYISVDQSNSTLTTEKPVDDADRTRRTPVAPFMAVSTGNVTIVSTSSGAIPGASVMMVTVGAFRSGKISTSVLTSTMQPATSMMAERITTLRRLISDQCMILLSMSEKFSGYVNDLRELLRRHRQGARPSHRNIRRCRPVRVR